ncbi:MAG: hypothetical protein ABIN97_05815 [Ginsengibacter sp.]
MRKLLFIMSLVITTNTIAQKIVEDKIDQYDGTRMIETNTQRFGNNLQFHIIGYIFKKENNIDTSLRLIFYFRPVSVTSLNRSQKLIFTFNDSTILSLEYSGSYQRKSSEELMYSACLMSGAMLEKLKTNTITEVRLETTNHFCDFEIPFQYQKLIPESVELVMNKIKHNLSSQ